MTVRELISILTEFEMDTDVVIICNDSNTRGHVDFRNIDTEGNTELELHLQTEDLTLIPYDEFNEMEERIKELEEELEVVKND